MFAGSPGRPPPAAAGDRAAPAFIDPGGALPLSLVCADPAPGRGAACAGPGCGWPAAVACACGTDVATRPSLEPRFPNTQLTSNCLAPNGANGTTCLDFSLQQLLNQRLEHSDSGLFDFGPAYEQLCHTPECVTGAVIG